MCGQGEEDLERVFERWHEIAWVAAWMGNIQRYVEGLHTWGKRLTLACMENMDVLKINADDDDM